MNKLNANWLTQGLIDFEYKQYILLAYLKSVKTCFDEQKLYPFLTDLIFHYKNLVSLRENKKIVSAGFPKKLSKIDLENFTLAYEKMMGQEEYLDEIESIVDFALPKIKAQLNDGKEIYDFVEQHINIDPIGIVPINNDAGYLFLRTGKTTDTQVYEYEVTIFENVNEKYRGLKTSYLTTYVKSFSRTMENIKIDLVKNNKHLGNPATYLVDCEFAFPLNETLLPVAKRSFVRYLANA